MKFLLSTAFLFMCAGLSQAQNKEAAKIDKVLEQLAEINKSVLEMKKEQNAKLAKHESDIKKLQNAVKEQDAKIEKLHGEIVELRKTVAELKAPVVPVVAKSQPAPTESTVRVCNVHNAPITAVINGLSYPVLPNATLNVGVAAGRFSFRVVEIASSAGNYSVEPGKTWGYKVYTSRPQISPPVPQFVPLVNQPPPHFGCGR